MQRLWSVIDEARPGEGPGRWTYLIAFAASSWAVIASESLHWLTGTSMPFVLGLSAVFISAFAGGARPALLAAGINVGAGLLIAHPGADINKPANLVTFAFFTLALAFAGERYMNLRRDDRALGWKLKQREQYLQSLFNTLPASIMITSVAGEILAMNHAARDLFGFEIGSILDLNVRELIGLDRGSTMANALSRNEHADGLALRQIGGRRRTGEPLDLSIAVTDITSGGINLATIYIRDETEMKASTSRLAGLRSQIEQLGRASAVAAMGSAIAHELNQPLAAAANFANAARSHLQRMAHPPTLVKCQLDDVVDQIYKAGEIVRGLRDFVRASPTSLQWVNARAAAKEATGVVRFLLDDRKIKVINIIDEHLEMWTDRIQIQQVFVNLFTNSVDAISDEERKEIIISSRIGQAGRLELCVSDSGGGVDTSIAADVFLSFKTTKPDGLGVGLSISKQIIDAHGGSIWQDDSAAQTTFCFTLTHRYR